MEESSAAGKNPVLYRYRFGTAEYDALRRELRVGGIVVDLEPKPMDVLAVLLAHIGEAVSREQLLDTVWGRRPAIDNLVANTVLKLRRALGPENAERITTLPRIGFRIDEPVERIAVGRQQFGIPDLKPGMAVPARPHWVLERRLGPTGGSDVWLARHAKTSGLRVFKFAGDGSRLAALKREVTLYRLLTRALPETEAFAEITDWNFTEPPFFVEGEYAGENLLEWSARDGQLSRLPRDGRIALFLQIADAVSAAHGVGVLHKDLKPTNVLIQARAGGTGWHLRLTDFGSARLLESERLAELGITVMGLTREFGSVSSGTPIYMAPELVAGHSPTLRSDLYALGVMLYQLLVGDLSRPLATGWEQDIDDPLLRADVAGAVHGDPAQRLGSVAELAGRLRALDERRGQRLAQQRSEAEAAELSARAAKARARRPLVIATIGILASGLAVSAALYVRAETALREASRQQARAEAINRFLTDDVLGAANPLRSAETVDPPVSQVLAEADRRLEGRFAEDPYVKASVHLAIGRAQNGAGNWDAARKQRARAVELLETSVADGDALLLRAKYDLASSDCSLHHFDEALALLDKTDAVATRARAADFALDIAANTTRGNCYYTQIRPDQAVPLFEKALARLDADSPADLRQRGFIGTLLADGYTRLGRLDEGERLARELLTIDQSMMSLAQRGLVGVKLGMNLLGQGRNQEALAALQEAHRQLSESLGAENRQTLGAMSHIANVHSALGDWPRVLEASTVAWAGFRRQAGEDDPTVLFLSVNRGIAQYLSGQFAEAGGTLDDAYTRLRRSFPDESAMVQMTAFYLASTLVELEQIAKATEIAARVDAKILTAASPGSTWDAQFRGLQGQLLLDRDPANAKKLLEAAVRTLEAEAKNQPWHAERLRASLAKLETAH